MFQRGTYGFPKREQDRAALQLFGFRDDNQGNRSHVLLCPCSQTYFRFPGNGDRNGHHGNDDLTASGSYNNGVINGINRIGLGGYGLGGYGGGIGLGQQIRVSEIRQVILKWRMHFFKLFLT